jgi:hypothetical protein
VRRAADWGGWGVDGRIMLKMMLKELVVGMLTGSDGTGCWLLACYV